VKARRGSRKRKSPERVQALNHSSRGQVGKTPVSPESTARHGRNRLGEGRKAAKKASQKNGKGITGTLDDLLHSRKGAYG